MSTNVRWGLATLAGVIAAVGIACADRNTPLAPAKEPDPNAAQAKDPEGPKDTNQNGTQAKDPERPAAQAKALEDPKDTNQNVARTEDTVKVVVAMSRALVQFSTEVRPNLLARGSDRDRSKAAA